MNTTTDNDQGPQLRPEAPLSSSFKQFMSRLWRNRGAMVGAFIVLALTCMAIFAPYLASYDPEAPDYPNRFSPPSVRNPFGTDEMGRDILSRIIIGSRVSLSVGLIAVSISLTFGTVLGLLAGFVNRLEHLIMRMMDVMLAFPGMLLSIAIVAALGPGLQNVMIAVGIFSIPSYVRIVHGTVLSVKQLDYIEAARMIGLREGRIILRHVLPNVLAPIIVLTTFRMATAILSAAGLSFLGLGAQPPDPEWGMMRSLGRHYILRAWWIVTFPGLMITLVILGFNLLGDGLRDALDPRLKT